MVANGMDRRSALDLFLDEFAKLKWHWLSYHFHSGDGKSVSLLAASIVDSCVTVEPYINGFTKKTSKKLFSFRNKEKFMPHYEQIIQLLAELYVFRHLVLSFPVGTEFVLEPTATGSGENPEVGVTVGGKSLFFEVKCRQFVEHHNERADSQYSLVSRFNGSQRLGDSLRRQGDAVVAPRDNVVKDFLVSADSKFAGFKKQDPSAICILLVAWDDHSYEPISSLLSPSSGLLTENSYLVERGSAVKFRNIDGVLIMRLSHQIVMATREEYLHVGVSHPLEWGAKGTVIPKAFIPVSALTNETQEYLCDVLEAHHIDELSKFSDYRPQEIVLHV